MDTSKIKSVILGHAVGDALGVPIEFASREELDGAPLSAMVGFGTYPYPAGTWSDDTSMSLCALDVLADGKDDLDLIMINFGRWYYNNEFAPSGEMFDVGNTCSLAIDNYFAYKKPIGECGLSDVGSNGNGSLMRIHPFVLYLYAKDGKLTKEGLDLIFRGSAMTHAHMRSKLACGIYAYILMNILEDPTAQSVYKGINEAKKAFENEPEAAHYSRIFDKGFADLPRNEIKSGGYVVEMKCPLSSRQTKKQKYLQIRFGFHPAAQQGGIFHAAKAAWYSIGVIEWSRSW